MSGREAHASRPEHTGGPWRFLRDELASVLLAPVLAGCALIVVASLSIGIHAMVLEEPEPPMATAPPHPPILLWDCTPMPGSDIAPFDCGIALTMPE